MSRTKIDYSAAERDYISGSDSIRSLSDKFGVAFSSMAEYARNHEWNAKRASYRSSVSETALANTAERHVSDREEMLDEALKLIRASMYEYGRQLRAGEVAITPKDLSVLVNAMQVITGGATNRTEATVLGINVTADAGAIDLAVLRDIERIARAKLVGSGMEGPAPIRIEGSSVN